MGKKRENIFLSFIKYSVASPVFNLFNVQRKMDKTCPIYADCWEIGLEALEDALGGP
jgi:hypothetical protein